MHRENRTYSIGVCVSLAHGPEVNNGQRGMPIVHVEQHRSWTGYDVRENRWVTLSSLSVPTMDHRSVVVAGEHLVVAGGMVAEQVVSDHVAVVPVAAIAVER